MPVVDYRSRLAKSLMMGPSSLRIAEELCADFRLPAGGRVLDLGCGRGLSTLHLAERFPDSLIVAADLWIEPEENLAVFRDAGVHHRVIPVKAEARELPFAKGYFDLIVSIDSYHYFGGDPEYLGAHLAPLLAPGGTLLMAVPGWKAGHVGGVPEALTPWLKDDMFFRTAEWWRALWQACPLVTVSDARDLDCCREAWDDWLSCDNEYARDDAPMMEAEAGRWFSIAAVRAIRQEP